MALTLPKFRERVALSLGVLAAGEALEASDDVVLTDLYNEAYDVLEALSLVDWGSTEPIPDDRVSVMVDIVAARAAPIFGVPADKQAVWEARAVQAEVRLRYLMATEYTGSTKATYY